MTKVKTNVIIAVMINLIWHPPPGQVVLLLLMGCSVNSQATALSSIIWSTNLATDFGFQFAISHSTAQTIIEKMP